MGFIWDLYRVHILSIMVNICLLYDYYMVMMMVFMMVNHNLVSCDFYENLTGALKTRGIFGNDPLANYQFHNPSNPQQPIHSLCLAPGSYSFITYTPFPLKSCSSPPQRKCHPGSPGAGMSAAHGMVFCTRSEDFH